MPASYLSKDYQLRAYQLFLGPGAADILDEHTDHGDFKSLKNSLLKQRRRISGENKTALKKRKATADEIKIGYQLLHGNYPYSRPFIDTQIEDSDSAYNFVNSLIYSRKHFYSRSYIKNLITQLRLRHSKIVNDSKFIFLHVPKCSGNSFEEYCKYTLKQECYFTRSLDFNLRSARRSLVIGGHRPIDFYDEIKADSIFICILRDPVARGCSLFRHHIWEYENVRSHRKHLKGFIFDDMKRCIMKSRFSSNFIDDLQCRYICGESNFEAAINSIHRNNFIVLTLDHIDLLPGYLASTYGFMPASYPARNRNRYQGRVTIDEKDAQLLDVYNQNDRKLYEYVKERGIIDTVNPELARRMRDKVGH